ALPAAEEFVVLQPETPRFRPVEKIRGINLSVERYREADVGEQPVFAQPFVEGTRNVRWLVVRQQGLDLSRELALMFGEQVGRFFRDGIRDALVKQRSLAFEHELLVAQRADGEPCQHEAG